MPAAALVEVSHAWPVRWKIKIKVPEIVCATGPSVIDLSVSGRSLAGSEGPGPLNRKQKQGPDTHLYTIKHDTSEDNVLASEDIMSVTRPDV